MTDYGLSVEPGLNTIRVPSRDSRQISQAHSIM